VESTELTGSNPYTAYADTRYNYDVAGNLLAVATSTASDGPPGSFLRETTMGYDALGRKTSMNDQDMGVWAYSYGGAGNLDWQKDSAGKVICFYYDNLNRLLRRAANGTSTSCPDYAASPASGANHLASYRYGGNVGAYNNGRLIEVNWGPSPTANKDTLAYDSEGRLSQQTRLVAGEASAFSRVIMTSLTGRGNGQCPMAKSSR